MSVTGSVGQTGGVSYCILHETEALQLITLQIIRVKTLTLGHYLALLKSTDTKTSFSLFLDLWLL